MNSTETQKLEDAIQQLRQAEQKVVFVRETILSLQEPTLAQLTVLGDCQMNAYSEHLEGARRAIRLAPNLEEEIDCFEELFREVSRVMARRYVAATRTLNSPSKHVRPARRRILADAATCGLESQQADIPEQLDEYADTKSDFIDVANRRPQQQSAKTSKRAESVDQSASTESPKDVATCSSSSKPLLSLTPSLGLSDGRSKTEPDPARNREIQIQPDRVHADSDHEKKNVEGNEPSLPSRVKAPDKRSQISSSFFHPDYGPILNPNPTKAVPGQLSCSPQLHGRRHQTRPFRRRPTNIIFRIKRRMR